LIDLNAWFSYYNVSGEGRPFMDKHLRELIRADFNRITRRERLDVSAAVERLILVQTVEGHAHNGHGEFRQRRFVDVTTADVVRALRLNPAEIKEARQKLIDDVFAWAERAVAGDDASTALADADAKPLLSIPFLAEFAVDPGDVLRGLYVGSLRDNSEVRAAVEAEAGVAIGGGSCYVVDTDVMREMGLDGEALAHGAHEDELDGFRARGLIVDLPAEEVDDDRYRYMYVRDREGPGHSDDAAFVFAGLLWGEGCALGVFLADAVDSLEKYSQKYSNQDDELGRMVAASDAFDASWEEDLKNLTYLATVPEDADDLVPDSSLRYFLRVDADASRCALQNHLDFIAGRPTVPMVLGFDRVLSVKFYRWVRERLLAYRARVAAPLRAAATLSSVAGAVDRSFLTVNVNDDAEEVAEAFAKSSAEVAVVVDDDGEVVGTVRAGDLLRSLWGRER
jgi:CBS domain-containing protein